MESRILRGLVVAASLLLTGTPQSATAATPADPAPVVAEDVGPPLPPDRARPTADGSLCDRLQDKAITLPRNVQPDIALETGSDRLWAPRHGTFRFWVRGWPKVLAQTPPVICFRWNADVPATVRTGDRTFAWMQPQARARIVATDAEGVLVEASVANLPNAPTRKSFFRDLWELVSRDQSADPSHGVYTAMNLVPVARMMITLRDDGHDGDLGAQLFYRLDFDVGVTSVQASTLVTVILGVLFLVTLSRIRMVRNPALNTVSVMLRLITTREGRASLSQLQILVWSFVIGCGAVYVMCLTGDLIDIKAGTLILLGISGSTSLGAELRNRQITKVAAGTDLDGLLPVWADIITSHDGTEIDASRVQMLFFTLIAALFVAIKIITSYTIPDIPEGFLALMGISNGVFVTSAFIQPMPIPNSPAPSPPAPPAKSGAGAGAPAD